LILGYEHKFTISNNTHITPIHMNEVYCNDNRDNILDDVP